MSQKYNIIWIVCDGTRNYPTPSDPERMGKPLIFNEISKEGIEFTNAVTSATSTLMAVTSMMTSITAYYLSRNLDDLRLERHHFESLGIILENAGYSVYNISFFYEMRREYWKEFLRPVSKKYWTRGCKAMVHWNNEPMNPIFFKILEKGIKEPFFLYVHYNARRDAEYPNRVKALINRLKNDGFLDKSIMIICSDHGMPDPERREHYLWLKERNLLFNRHDLVMTDDNICVPLLLRYPKCPKNMKISTTVGLIDIVPTILDVLQIPYGEKEQYGKQFRGVSLIPLIERRNLDFYASRKIRTDTRYIAQRDRMISIRGTGYKYVYFKDIPSSEKEQFYDLRKDKLESKNLIASNNKLYQTKIEEYRKEYRRQEIDAIYFQEKFLLKKFRFYIEKKLHDNLAKEAFKIITMGSCNPYFLKFITTIIKETFKKVKIDLLIERNNSVPNKELVSLGFRNITFIPTPFNYKESKKSLLNLMESYDLCLVPITDYIKDYKQYLSKSTEGKMQMSQFIVGQYKIDKKLLSDYKDIFKIAKKIKATHKIYFDYNMNIFRSPRFIIFLRLIKKMIAKIDIYYYNPKEIISDIILLSRRKKRAF